MYLMLLYSLFLFDLISQVVIVESEHVIILTLCILIFGIHYIKMSGWLPVLDNFFWGGGVEEYVANSPCATYGQLT